MNALALKWGAMAVVVLALMAGSFAAAWAWQANSYGKAMAAAEANHQADLTKIANASAEQARHALAKQQVAEAHAAESDAKYTQEKADGLAKNEK